MNLSRFILNYQLVYQILFLWLISFNDVFGCIATRYKKKDNKKREFSEIPVLSATLACMSHTNNQNEPNIISSFQKFLATNYNWKTKVEDLSFLWDALKIFSIRNGYTSRPCTFRKPKNKSVKYKTNNTTLLTLKDIETYLETVDKGIPISGISNDDNTMHKANINENIYFYEYEKQEAFRSLKNLHEFACKVRNVTFCLREFLKSKNNGLDNLSQSIPPAVLLKRCPTKCSCVNPYEECVPTTVANRTEYIYLVNNEEKQSTLALVLVDHLDCKCRKRCGNKRCISHFEMVHRAFGSCECECIAGHEKVCKEILKGHKHFNITDYNCIVRGICDTPDCVAGELSEEQLYNGRCPPIRLY